MFMDNWLSKVLIDISEKHTISNEKARLLFEKILAVIFGDNITKKNAKLLNEGSKNGDSRIN